MDLFCIWRGALAITFVRWKCYFWCYTSYCSQKWWNSSSMLIEYDLYKKANHKVWSECLGSIRWWGKVVYVNKSFSKNSDDKCTGNFTLNNFVHLKILFFTEASDVRKEAYLDFVKTWQEDRMITQGGSKSNIINNKHFMEHRKLCASLLYLLVT